MAGGKFVYNVGNGELQVGNSGIRFPGPHPGGCSRTSSVMMVDLSFHCHIYSV